MESTISGELPSHERLAAKVSREHAASTRAGSLSAEAMGLPLGTALGHGWDYLLDYVGHEGGVALLVAANYAEKYGPISYSHVAAGMFSCHAGPKVRVLDRFGLVDPFVARRQGEPDSRVGHVERNVPACYLALRGVVNVLPDAEARMAALDGTLIREAEAPAKEARWPSPEMERRWADVQVVVSGDLFSWQRLRRIPRYILGRV